MLNEFYLNVVGYKVDIFDKVTSSLSTFYLNVVGYKVGNSSFIYMLIEGFI